jgi:dipeptidyl aminopeptidase/acylaminoacyl peptidase
VVAILALVAVGYNFATRPRRVPFAHYSIQKVMDSKHVMMTAISPDGNYLAAVIRDGAQSLVLHHIPTNSERPILQDPAYKYHDVIFSPDGSYIYFKIDALGLPPGSRADEYRVPVLGGQPNRVVEDLQPYAPLSFIDGGRRLCFYRDDTQAGKYKFVSASADGGDEQILANGKKPYLSYPLCAPNGGFAVFSIDTGKIGSLDFASGSKRDILLPDAIYPAIRPWGFSGKDLLVTVTSFSHPSPQIGVLSYPGGELHQITNDLTDYGGISLNENGNTIATTSYERNVRFVALPLGDPAHFTERQISDDWFIWLDNDRILQSDPGARVIDLANDEATALNLANLHIREAVGLCGPDALVASGNLAGKYHPQIYKMHLDGSGQTALTKGPLDLFPRCTADGKWLFYVDNGDSGAYLMRQSLKDGTAQRVIKDTIWYNLSRDGKSLVSINDDNLPRLQVISTESLQQTDSFNVPKDVDPEVAFAADGKSVFYSTRNGLDTTIWRWSLGASSAVKVTTIPGRFMAWMEASPDGKRLGISLFAPTSEAVLIRDVP